MAQISCEKIFSREELFGKYDIGYVKQGSPTMINQLWNID